MPAPDHSNETPGPGHYDLQSEDLTRRARLTHNKPIAAGKGSFMSYGESDRSAPMFGIETDPTLYSDYYLKNSTAGRATSVNKKVQGGEMPFLSTMPRCVDPAFEDRSGARGPGTYDTYHMYGTGQKGAGSVQSVQPKSGGTSAFTNKAPLCGHVRKIDTPGVGEYSPEKVHCRGFSYSKAGSCAFAGNTPRCASDIKCAQDTDHTVGPQTYDVSHRSITAMLANKMNPRSPPFSSSSRRL